ncbi:hypothetical protein DYB28_006261 [Aphanomyces astaci]|uniref:Uncharacterized protein n=1 Tax=Aphanomyces astaci TaxID=112090 RepID=A0A9X8DV65_APHAT|nr:hypothetical protein DYB28_006261 [Aphanomyces astaci]
MRLANPDPTPDALVVDGGGRTPPCPMATPTPVATHSIVDPSDPHATIRKLLKHIEQLEASVDMYKAAASDSAVTSLVDEITRLRIENNNIPILQAEIHQLKATIRHSPPNYDDDDNQQPGTINDSSKSVKALQAENAALTRQVNKLRTMLAARQATDDNHGPVKQSKEETIQKTKLDMQQDRVARLYDLFCRPISFLTGQQRPSTSAGVLQTFAGPRQSSVPSSASSSAGRRQLHTSAGPRPRSKGAGYRVSGKKTQEDSPTDQVNNNTGCPDLLVLHS